VSAGYTLRRATFADIPALQELYTARGYMAAAPVHWPVGEGLTIEFVPMRKTLAT